MKQSGPGSTLCSQLRVRAINSQTLPKPPSGLVPMAAEVPEPGRAYCNPQTGRGITAGDGRLQGRRDIGAIRLQYLQPTHLLRAPAQLGRCCLDQQTAPVPMRRFYQIRFAGLLQTFTSVLADGLQQPEAVLLHAFYDHNQRLVDQPPEQVQNVVGFNPRVRTDGHGRLDSPTASEDCQAPQQRALLLLQKVITPVDRAPQCLLPRQDGPPSPTEKAESVGQAASNLFRREQFDPSRGKLERQWNPVEPGDNRNHRSHVGGGYREAWPYCKCSIHEQSDGGEFSQCCEVSRFGRNRKRRNRHDDLARYSKRLPTRGENSEMSRALQ